VYSWPQQKRGAEHPRSLYSSEQVEQMTERREQAGVTYRQLAEEYGGSIPTVRKAIKSHQRENG
jgi:transposase-like protein